MEAQRNSEKVGHGDFPSDWPLASLGSVITDFRGGAPLKPSDFTASGTRVLAKGSVGHSGWLRIIESDLQYCSEAYAASHARSQVDDTFTIVVLRDLVPSGPNIGLMARMRDRGSFVLAQGVYGFKVSNLAVPAFLVQLSRTKWYRRLANSIMVGSTQVHITNTAFKRAEIPLPLPIEQVAIASVLSDVDALIDSLDQLLAKKRLLKQGAMQELLTGKRRLPGFSGEWGVRRLGALIDLIPSGVYGEEFPRDSLEAFPVATTAHIEINDTWNSKPMNVRYFTREQVDRYSPRVGDLIVVKSSGSAASIQSGKIGYVERSHAGAFVFSNFLMLLRPHSILPRFLYFFLCSSGVKRLLPSLVEASTYPNIRIPEYLALDIPVPNPDEQSSIATLLSDMDAELAALEAKLAKARQIKQGMMQELLTGRIRLV